jgi:thioredoxin 1
MRGGIVNKPVIVTDATFEQTVVQAETPVLVDFSAEWCPPCRMAEPVLEEIADEYRGTLKVVTIDVDTNANTVAALGVSSMPTFILYKGGVPVERVIGYQPKNRLMSRLTPHLS